MDCYPKLVLFQLGGSCCVFYCGKLIVGLKGFSGSVRTSALIFKPKTGTYISACFCGHGGGSRRPI